MEQMDGYKELLSKLTALIDALEKGDLDLEQLNDLEAVTRKLHERSIILRFKAYENADISTTSDLPEKVADNAPDQESEAGSAEMKQDDQSEASEEEKNVEKEEEVVEEAAFDFDMFNTDEEIDISTTLDVPDKKVLDVQDKTPDEAAVNATDEKSPDVSNEVNLNSEVEDTSAAQNDEKIDAPKESEVTRAETPEETPEPPKAEETTIEAPEVPSSDIHVSPAEPVEVAGNSFLEKLAVQDNSIASRFSSRPLETLIGAFGLNERLRFINDLFDGSSEKFSDAIKALDNQSDIDAARNKASQYAQENNWDPEEEVVVEFMNYLNRRYA